MARGGEWILARKRKKKEESGKETVVLEEEKSVHANSEIVVFVIFDAGEY